MENELTDFLRRLPWASQDLLQNYFGKEKIESLLCESTRKIQTIMRADNKIYYSLKPGNERLLPGISRREMVRKFMAETYGYGIFDTAESPCFNADFRVFYPEQNIWIRVWGDMGYIAPECLMIFNNPPVFGNGIRDIILTCEGIERARFLNVQAEINWKNAQEDSVEIHQTEIPDFSPLVPDTSNKKDLSPYAPDKESEACSVPDAAHEKHHEYIDQNRRLSFIHRLSVKEPVPPSRPGQRNKDIVLQP